MSNTNPTIQVMNLEKKFGDFTAVNHISFEVHQGEIFGFLGPNGSGKTTSIRMMLGLLKPTSGAIKVLEKVVPEQTGLILPRIGYMSQQFSLYSDLTVIQNLHFYGQAYGIDPDGMDATLQDAIELSGLSGYENTPTKDLSGGWRQRLALSAAILHRPEVLFLDEPTAGVDPVSRRAFWDLLYQLVADGITVFITTHYMDEAEHCHRLAFIQHGRIIAQGTPSSIKSETLPGEVLEIHTTQPEPLLASLQAGLDNGDLENWQAELYGTSIHVITGNPAAAARRIRSVARSAKIKIEKISAIEPSLEDVFIACMRENIPGGSYEN
jgi:ABC-2 type transport system ATP-binding protein